MSANLVPNNETLEYLKNYIHQPIKGNLKLTSIVILTYNQLLYTKLCIESIRKFTHKDSYEIIVVDNNSTDDTVDWLKKQKDLKIICNTENKGFPAGCNQGIEIAKGDNILLLNNDTIVTPNWLNNLQTALYSKDDIGIVGAITNYAANYQQVDVNYTDIESMLNLSKTINISNPNMWDMRPRLIGFCYLFKREVLDSVGMLDERFTPGNFEDDDFSFRAICRDFKILLCKDAFVHHFGSVSFGQNRQNFLSALNTNLAKFNQKWGFNIQYSSGVRLELIQMLDKPVDEPIKVLEVGCGLGSTLLEIKNRYRNATIYGIEIDENVGQVTKHLIDAIIGNIETLELPYEENYFDYIIFGDVLEHLIDPWETLRNMKNYLKEDGCIIASIPNLMYIDDLTNLIRGFFSYVDAGILDRTHLRFFTLNEIQKLFTSTDYNIEFINAVANQPDSDREKVVDLLCQISSEDIRQQYSVYQYLVRARNKGEVPRYEQDDMLQLKFKLMRLDNGLDIDNSIDYILDSYLLNKDNFLNDFNTLLDMSVIDKQNVVDLVANGALARGLDHLYKLLK